MARFIIKRYSQAAPAAAAPAKPAPAPKPAPATKKATYQTRQELMKQSQQQQAQIQGYQKQIEGMRKSAATHKQNAADMSGKLYNLQSDMNKMKAQHKTDLTNSYTQGQNEALVNKTTLQNTWNSWGTGQKVGAAAGAAAGVGLAGYGLYKALGGGRRRRRRDDD